MKGVIYCYHCIPTGKKYIGKTKNKYHRKKRHEHNVRKGQVSKFYNAVRKYGWENFIYGIIEEFDIELLNEQEIYYIKFYNTYTNGYNMTTGGDGNTIPGELCKIRSREAILGKPRTEETKKKLREAHLGKPKHNEESKRKIREANLGKKYNLELRKKLSEIRKGCKGTPHTEETKKKLSEIAAKRNIGKKWWNDGHQNKFVLECPGENWIPGRCKKK
jgi:group I intron endonuclease